MSSIWSDDATMASTSWYFMEEEINRISEAVKEERGEKDLAAVAVASEDWLDKTEMKTRKRKWQFWKGRSLVLVTTPECLQDSIREARRGRKRSRMIIIAGADITTLSFNVRSPFRTLKVLRCADKNDKRRLIVRESSKFNNICLYEWQAERCEEKELYLGRGVRIYADPDRISLSSPSTYSLSSGQQEKLRRNLRKMRNTDMGGSGWQKWKGYVAAIVGATVTTTKLAAATQGSVSGLWVNLEVSGLFSLKAGGLGAKASTIVTAAGPAVLLGAGVAAAVYFIPWESVFEWLGGVFSSFWGWITSLWEQFKSWLDSKKRIPKGIPVFHESP